MQLDMFIQQVTIHFTPSCRYCLLLDNSPAGRVHPSMALNIASNERAITYIKIYVLFVKAYVGVYVKETREESPDYV